MKKNLIPTVTNTCGEPCENKWELRSSFGNNYGHVEN